MPNLHKAIRNAEIVRLFDNGKGLTHRQIADRLGMKTSAVSMVIMRFTHAAHAFHVAHANRVAQPDPVVLGSMLSVLSIRCAWCGCDMGTKDGKGQSGISHGLCDSCLSVLESKKGELR